MTGHALFGVVVATYDLEEPQMRRCPSCDHVVSEFHTGREGCRYTVTLGRISANLVCPCSWTPNEDAVLDELLEEELT